MSELIQVLPDLYQLILPTSFPVGPVNVYIARDANGLTLVDCGPRTSQVRAALNADLATLGCSVCDVRRILVTHAHAAQLQGSGLRGAGVGETRLQFGL